MNILIQLNMNTKRLYKVIKDVPCTSLSEGKHIIYTDEKYFHEDGCWLPFISNELLKEYCVECEIHPQIYAIGDSVSFIYGNKKRYGTILYYDLVRQIYKISFNVCKQTYISFLHEQELTQVEKYYYYSSSGEVNVSYIGCNPRTEYFRKKTNNFFKTQEECINYITKIFKDYGTTD